MEDCEVQNKPSPFFGERACFVQTPGILQGFYAMLRYCQEKCVIIKSIIYGTLPSGRGHL